MAAPAVTLMFNGSSYHALPALLSDFHEALAGVANGTDPRAGAALRSPALTPPWLPELCLYICKPRLVRSPTIFHCGRVLLACSVPLHVNPEVHLEATQCSCASGAKGYQPQMHSMGCAGPRIVTRNHPLPLTEAESIQLDFILMVLAAVFVLIPFCYLSGVEDWHVWSN